MREILSSRKVLLSLVALFLIYAAADVIMPGRSLLPDESFYTAEARSIAETGSLFAPNGHRAFGMPLTGIGYSVYYKIFGEGSAFVRACRVQNALLWILAGVGAASIAWSLFRNRTTTLISMYAVIIYPSFAAYQAFLLTEINFTFFLIWGFAFLFMWDGSEGSGRWFVLSVVSFVLSLYVKATITTLMPVLIAARSLIAVRGEGRWRRRAAYVAASCAIFAVMLAPWWVRNYRIFGEFVPFTTSASWNLYLGNNAANTTAGIGDGPNGDVEHEAVAEIRALGDELAVSRAFSERATRYIVGNKAVFLHNAWLKFKRFWNFRSNYTGTGYGWLFVAYNAALLLSWGIAFPLGLISFWLSRARWRELIPIYLLIAYFTLIHCVVIASLRYRLPIEPFFVILGADCVRRALDKFAKRPIKGNI